MGIGTGVGRKLLEKWEWALSRYVNGMGENGEEVTGMPGYGIEKTQREHAETPTGIWR